MFVLMWKRWVAQLDDYSRVLQYKVLSCTKNYGSNFKRHLSYYEMHTLSSTRNSKKCFPKAH